MFELFSETITWEELEIEVSCICEWPINTFCHIELRCDQKLPMTETGYRSHFMLLEYLEPYDNYIEFVKAWLEEASQSEAWKHHVEESRQLTLF